MSILRTRSARFFGIFCLLYLLNGHLPSALALAGEATASPVINSAAEIDYPPFSLVNEDGRADGFAVELMRAALFAMGRGVSFQTGPWTEVRGLLERGEIEALPLVGRTPEREALFDFTVPYMTLHGAIVVRSEETDVRDLGDLRNRRVAVMKGDNAEEFLRREERGLDIQTVPTFEIALRQLSEGRFDAVVAQKLVALRLIQKTGLTDLRVVERPNEGFQQDFCFAVREGDRETLAQLIQAQKMESVGRLAGGVAHDFNNMLSVILGNTEMALDQVEPAQLLFSDLQEVLKAGRRSADLTRQLLAFARQQTISPKVLDLNEVVEGMLKMLRRLVGEGVEMVWLPGHELWSVNMDPSKIDQILANLCINARDAVSDRGKVTIRTDNVTLDEELCTTHVGVVSGSFVALTVGDDGCGMDSETLGSLFEPFFTTKGAGKGTGLGLATVYGIVKQNKGCIDVRSEPGSGTTFTVYLPKHTAHGDEVKVEEATPSAPGGRETILLVEDEKAILSMTENMLTRLGYRVLATDNPVEALNLACAHAGDIELVVTDVIMPEMNGKELTERLTVHCPNIPCLFMSGYTADIISHHGVLEEGVHFIRKPFSKKDLATKVREALSAIPRPGPRDGRGA